MSSTRAGVLLALSLTACGGGGYRPDGPARDPEPPITDGRGRDVRPLAARPPAPGRPLQGTPPSTRRPPASRDAPEISRSVGRKGGLIVLWPRIVMPQSNPKPDPAARKAATRLQQHLVEIVRRALPGRDLDVRPEPERACPRPAGCAGVAVGVLLARAGDTGCSAVALVSEPGPSSARLVPWAGEVVVQQPAVLFREPPERAVRFKDFAQCAGVLDAARSRDAAVEAAVRGAAVR